MKNIIDNLFDRDFQDDDLDKFLISPNSMRVHDIVNDGLLSSIAEGETVVDKTNNRKITKYNGVLYKEIVEDNQIKMEKL